MNKQKTELIPLWRLKGRIKEYKYTIRSLAPLTGMAPSSLCNKANGKADFNCLEIQRLASLLEIDRRMVGEYFFPKLPYLKNFDSNVS